MNSRDCAEKAREAASHGQQNDDATTYTMSRRLDAPDCTICDSRGPVPPHDASPNCESGKREHCSCDVCF